MHLSPTDFAKRMGYSLPGITDILNKQNMNTEVLIKVCNVLGYDFFSYLVEQLPEEIRQHKTAEPHAGGELRTAELEKELAEVKKENAYLKKINDLLEKKG